jgi:transposase
LACLAGRIKASFLANPHAQGILSQAVAFNSADLIYHKGQFRLHLVVTLPDVQFCPSGDVVGVDMGLSRPAVCSNNRFFGLKRWREIAAGISG